MVSEALPRNPWAVDTPAKRLLFHTVRVETEMADGGSGTGTAFVVSHVHARGRTAFVVTNRHLVDDVVRGSLVFVRAADGSSLWLAGVVAAVFFREESLRLSPAPVPARTSLQATGSEMIDLGLVIKAQTVRELLHDYLRHWQG